MFDWMRPLITNVFSRADPYWTPSATTFFWQRTLHAGDIDASLLNFAKSSGFTPADRIGWPSPGADLRVSVGCDGSWLLLWYFKQRSAEMGFCLQ